MESAISLDRNLVKAAQFNCDLSDAHYAGNYTMCIYLLKMREYYRWRFEYELGERLPMDAVGEWVQKTEGLWDEIEEQEYRPIPVAGELCGPFDDLEVNARLEGTELVFSSGIGRFGKPIFFLAEKLESRQFQDFSVTIAGKEFARELAAPPAMVKDRQIYVRRQSLSRLLFELLEEWRWHRRTGAMGRVVEHYGLENHDEHAFKLLIDDQLDQVLLHEVGECRAGELLGENWDPMLKKSLGHPVENIARASRDCLADCLVVLPQLVEQQRPELLHFYLATLTPLRKALMPGLLSAYKCWIATGSPKDIAVQASGGISHWTDICWKIMHTLACAEKKDWRNLLDIESLAA